MLVTGFVLFTLFVNAPTMGVLISTFGLDKLSPADIAVRDRVMQWSLSGVKERVEELASDLQVAPEFAREVAHEYYVRLREVNADLPRAEHFPLDDRMRIALTTLLNRERQTYVKLYTQGFASAVIARRLFARADDLLDAIKANGLEGYTDALAKQLGYTRAFQFANTLQRRFSHVGMLATQLSNRFVIFLITQMVLRELVSYNRGRIGQLFGKDVDARLAGMLDKRLERTGEQLDALKLQYPEYANTLQRRLLERTSLRLEDRDYTALLDQSIINADVFKSVQKGIRARYDALGARPVLNLGLEPEKLVAKVPFFDGLGPERIAAIAALLKPRLVLPGERIMVKGEAGDAMYFISTGAVSVDVKLKPVRLGSGDFFGEIALLTDKSRIATVVALSYCQVLALYTKDCRKLMDVHPDLREHITRVAQERLGADAAPPA